MCTKIMFIKKIPSPEQALILASSRINTYKKAVEELVYNALDAESTSIAIRVHIEQASIQVVDNGCGITKKDFNVLGKRHMTSKFTDKANSKSVSNKYGYRGEFLANVIEVSKTIRIISRYEGSDATWEKCFHNGHSKKIVEIERRPSKGTTIEIKGLFYNLTIQNKCVNHLNELQKIKLFLERIALVHSNVSLSLRDDYRNEIVFQLHKNRNIYQTISYYYGIDKSEIQELKVQKNQYAVVAFIAKNIKDTNKQWIFLNREYINNTSRLYKIVNDNLNKSLNNKYHRKKSKIKYDDEEIYLLNKLPFYLLFIQCPVTDYDIFDTLIEFNNWNQITMLLEKLVKFYVGDITLKSVTINISQKENKNVSEDTREQVKHIINKILASNSKALGVSQMQNGIKGKITKREHKKKHKTSLKLISQKKIASKRHKLFVDKNDANIDHCEKKSIETNTVHKNLQRKNSKKVYEKLNKTQNQFTTIEQKENIPSVFRKQAHVTLGTKSKIKSNELINNSIIRRFINPTDSVKKRCEILAKKAQDVLDNFNNRPSAGHIDKSVQYNCNDLRYKSINVCNNTQYKHQYDKLYLQQNEITNLDTENRHNDIKSNYDLLKTITKIQANNKKNNQEYQPLVSHKNKFTNHKNKSLVTSYKVTNTGPVLSKLTYESHNYEVIRSKKEEKLNKLTNRKFMSKDATDYFITSSDDISRPKVWQRNYTYNRHINERHQTFVKNTTFPNIDSSLKCSTIQNIEEYSEIIEGPKNSLQYNTRDKVNTILQNYTWSSYQTENISLFIQSSYQNISDNMELILDKTQILPKDHTINNNNLTYLQESIHFNAVSHHAFNANIETSDSMFTEGSNGTDENQMNNEKNYPQITYIPDSQNSSKSNTHALYYTPMDVCETVYLENCIFEKEIQNSFNNDYQRNLNIDANPNDIVHDVDKEYQTCNTQFIIENTSHYFSYNNTLNSLISNTKPGDKANTSSDVIDKKQTSDPMHDNLVNNIKNDKNHNQKCEKTNLNTFDMKNRLHFVPKGMSPIFKNCNTKETCCYNLDTDYYHDSLYHNFINEVQANTEIYMEQIQNVHDNEMKNIRKNKTETTFSLNFNGKSLECAKILNQVDNKFIAAIIKNNQKHNEESSNFLVLFDQHAVHERIRLENNLSEYVVNDLWKSVSIDDMTMLLKRDEILYLHNYKEKFAQLGLRWTMPSSNEITITGIPEAILGKNPRQADKIMIAVRNLITEQINNIKSQNGCISVYPKSIMDLVSSEACRYAVMFGDKLTGNYCEELLRALSKCKKPFQCAHGRPVMAVLMDLEYNKREYKANLTKLKCFK